MGVQLRRARGRRAFPRQPSGAEAKDESRLPSVWLQQRRAGSARRSRGAGHRSQLPHGRMVRRLLGHAHPICVKKKPHGSYLPFLHQSVCAGKPVGRDGQGYRPVHEGPAGSLVYCWVWSSSPHLYGALTSGHTPEAPHRSSPRGVRITSPPAVGQGPLMLLGSCEHRTLLQDFIALALTRVFGF